METRDGYRLIALIKYNLFATYLLYFRSDYIDII